MPSDPYKTHTLRRQNAKLLTFNLAVHKTSTTLENPIPYTILIWFV